MAVSVRNMMSKWKTVGLVVVLWLCLVSARLPAANKHHINKTSKRGDAVKVNDIKPVGKEWLKFKTQYGKRYSAKEEILRRDAWETNVRAIAEHNAEHAAGLHTFTMGLNEYSDLTPDEYRKYLLGARAPVGERAARTNIFKLDKTKSVPESMDWVQLGYVTNIKNQGACGSCWAFSSTGALEGMHFRRTGYLVELSEQNLVDCTLKLGNAGCNGGWMNTAFRYVRENGGIDYEQEYPYRAITEKNCHYDSDYSGTTCAAHADVDFGSEEDLQGASATVGPISVAIDANHKSFMNYKSGLFYEPKCSNKTTDHAVLLVGYGTTPAGEDYWLVKNSWGTSWGMQGYIRMSRNRNNNCAIASYASFPLEYYTTP